MRAVHFLLLIPALASLQGCRPAASLPETRVWEKGSGPAPAFLKSEQFARSDRSVMVGKEIITFSTQHWGEAELDGGLLVLIEERGEARYARADYRHSPDVTPNWSRETIRRLHGERFQFLEAWLKRHSWLKRKPVSEPTLVLLPAGRGFHAAYRVDLEGKEDVVRFWITPDGSTLRKEKASTELFDAEAWIYTLSNGKSVQEVLLRKMLEGVDVRSQSHGVTSQAPTRPDSENAPWKFPPGDPRFDQVQAYYYIQQALDFFVSALDFTLPVKIEAETAVGFPEGTAAAFAYNNQVRFGSGDGTRFRSMAQDPSIVIHEVGHVLNGVLARLPTQGEGGSLNEAFADYFAASCLNDPKLGARAAIAGPLRNIENQADFAGRDGKLYHDSLIVSGTLWEIRSRLGAAAANRLAVKTLTRLGGARSLADFPPALRSAAAVAELSPAERGTIDEVLRRRKWEN